MKYLSFAFKNKAYQFRVLPFRLNTALKVLTRLGHKVAAYLHRQEISVIPYVDNWLIHHPDRQVLLRQQSQLLEDTGPGRPQVERSKIQTGSSSGYPVSGALITCGSGESFPPNIQGSGDNSTCVPKILPNSFVAQRSVPVHGITQLGLGSYPTGSVIHEALTTTFSFVRFDKPVYTCVDKTL